MISGVPDPGMLKKFSPSPASYPAVAAFPPSPFIPPDSSPVVHCISPSAYKNIVKDRTPSVASTH